MEKDSFQFLSSIRPINKEFQKFIFLFKIQLLKPIVFYVLSPKERIFFYSEAITMLTYNFIPYKVSENTAPGRYIQQQFTWPESPSSRFEICLEHFMLLFGPQMKGFLLTKARAQRRNRSSLRLQLNEDAVTMHTLRSHTAPQ